MPIQGCARFPFLYVSPTHGDGGEVWPSTRCRGEPCIRPIRRPSWGRMIARPGTCGANAIRPYTDAKKEPGFTPKTVWEPETWGRFACVSVWGRMACTPTEIKTTRGWAFCRGTEIKTTRGWAFRRGTEIKTTCGWAFRRGTEIKTTRGWDLRRCTGE